MRRMWLFTLVLLLAGAMGLQAQEYVDKADTVVVKPRPLPVTDPPAFSVHRPPIFLFPTPGAVESKEERAARINQETYNRVMASVQQNLEGVKPRKLSTTEMVLLSIGKLFLTSPYSFPQGAVPLMNASNPFVYVYPPGGAPYFSPYSTDAFPQSIRTEYDFRSGTYRQVMVQWEDLERSMVRSYGGSYRNEAVPPMQFSSDRWIP